MKAVNLSRYQVLHLTPLATTIILCSLTFNLPAEASLFDPERGQQQAAEAATNSGSSLRKLRLDGILALGDQHRVLISGPEGETYRFNWQGAIDAPMAFKGESADQLVGYELTSADSRSVWLQLPSDTDCELDPDNGITACENGRMKLALVRRSFPPTLPPTAEEIASGNGVQQASPPALAGRPQRENRTPLTNWTRNRGAEVKVSSIQQQKEQPVVINSTSSGYIGGIARSGSSGSNESEVPQSLASPQPQVASRPAKTEADYPQLQNPERVRIQQEQQELINTAPPNYFGVQ